LPCEEAGPTQISLDRESGVIGLVYKRPRAPTRMAAGLLLLAGMAVSRTEAGEPGAVLELGAAGEHSLKGGGPNFGPTMAIDGERESQRRQRRRSVCAQGWHALLVRRLDFQHASVRFVRAHIKIAIRRHPHVADAPVQIVQ
jgi:hypothetical protein